MKSAFSTRLRLAVLVTFLFVYGPVAVRPAPKPMPGQDRASGRTRKLTLQEIVASERTNRAAAKRTGVRVLFTGPCATEKRVAAEVLAREAGADLYRVDPAMIVSKYIGETEKNLQRVFQAAETRHAVLFLFFDEADALFGKRSEVKDSHDRYANIEVNYLLQRIEEYQGLAILATGHKDNIDKAFLRRIRFVVGFCD